MTTTLHIRFRFETVDMSDVHQARVTRVDVSGNPVVEVTAGGGEPLRCCLRDAKEGEQLILFGYEPRIPASPYREIGAIFAHAESCSGTGDTHEYPAAWRGRPQLLRAYDERGWITDARVHDGAQPESVIAELFAIPDVVEIHSRNIAYGCFMFAIRRAC
jgi:Protein of unknown function (DUF1203)